MIVTRLPLSKLLEHTHQWHCCFPHLDFNCWQDCFPSLAKVESLKLVWTPDGLYEMVWDDLYEMVYMRWPVLDGPHDMVRDGPLSTSQIEFKRKACGNDFNLRNCTRTHINFLAHLSLRVGSPNWRHRWHLFLLVIPQTGKMCEIANSPILRSC